MSLPSPSQKNEKTHIGHYVDRGGGDCAGPGDTLDLTRAGCAGRRHGLLVTILEGTGRVDSRITMITIKVAKK